MMTGKHLQIQRMGEAVLGVRLNGNKAQPEPEAFRICFPGGDVEVTRTTDNQYWVHVRVNHPEDGYEDRTRLHGTISDARLDMTDQHAADVDPGDFHNPKLYHLAVKIQPRTNDHIV